jgi:hypothetical protein
LAAHDHLRFDRGFGGGGRERPDALRSARGIARDPCREIFCKRGVFYLFCCTIVVIFIGFVLVGAEAVGETIFKFVKAAPFSVYRVRGLRIQ